MLWEAIKKENAVIIPFEKVTRIIDTNQFVYIIPEPLPAIYMGVKPAYKKVRASSLLQEHKEYLKVEPVYIISEDFSWMIVLTTENTPDGKQLCCYTRRQTD